MAPEIAFLLLIELSHKMSIIQELNSIFVGEKNRAPECCHGSDHVLNELVNIKVAKFIHAFPVSINVSITK